MGRRLRRHAGRRRQSPAERSGLAALLRPRRAHDGAEGELPDADAHRSAFKYAGAIHQHHNGIPMRGGRRAMKAFLLVLMLTVTPLAGANAADPPQSIYNLQVQLTDQSGAARRLDMQRGHPVLITMFYGSC